MGNHTCMSHIEPIHRVIKKRSKLNGWQYEYLYYKLPKQTETMR